MKLQKRLIHSISIVLIIGFLAISAIPRGITKTSEIEGKAGFKGDCGKTSVAKSKSGLGSVKRLN